MNTNELQKILSQEEGLKLDFKAEYKLDKTPPPGTDKPKWGQFVVGQWDEFIKDILALANGNVGTAGQIGLLIIGADDELRSDGTRQLYDTSHLQLSSQQILERVNRACNPPLPDICCERIAISGITLCVITIPPTPHVHETTRLLETKKGNFDANGILRHVEDDKKYTERTVFLRRREGIYPASSDERQALKVEKSLQPSFESRYFELDKKLFLEIRNLLPSNGSIEFIRKYDYGGAFDTREHEQLSGFLEFCEHPECQFMDLELENLRQELQRNDIQFMSALGRYTFPLQIRPERNRIPRDPYQEPETIIEFRKKAKDENEFNELVEQRRIYIREIHNELNNLADQVSKTYEEFIRVGRKKLAV